MSKTDELLNEQIVHELFSAYLYWAMAAYFHDRGLKGFAHWMEVQAKEELEHAEKFYNHLVEKGSKVVLGPIEKPPNNWSSPLQVFEEALKHEKKITNLIYRIGKTALEEEEYGTWEFLNWFYKEQIEEEDIVREVLDYLKIVGDDPAGLFALDRELSKR